jgi:hypothetical protein
VAHGKIDSKRVYRVSFQQQGKVYEIFARSVSQGELFGFVEIEQIVFGERSKLIVDSGEESLKTEFAGVKRIFVPLHAVIRIDEVDREGAASIRPVEGSGVASFPFPIPAGAKKPESR